MYSECHAIVTLADEDDDLDNAYELLGLEDDAGEKEIKADDFGPLESIGIHWTTSS